MAIHVYDQATGRHHSSIPEDLTIAAAQASGVLASPAALVANGFAAVDKLPPIGPTVGWDEAAKTTVPIAAPRDTVRPARFVMLFTPREHTAITASADDQVKQYWAALTVEQMVDLNQQEVTDAMNYFVSKGLLVQARADQILANQPPGP